jgi:hypothetical protein
MLYIAMGIWVPRGSQFIPDSSYAKPNYPRTTKGKAMAIKFATIDSTASVHSYLSMHLF